ncbi:MAG: U32 family peptidase [Lachnospiraceae bacterium]|nr:U32 family peptidase [Lachnospiraceae bacterium]
MNKVELLAPAGDMACFRAAVNAGADAVYLGGEEYGARAYASNFTEEEVCEAIRYAHLFGVKVYLTVNTLVKEKELNGLCRFMIPFYEAGLDGVIVQDFGVMEVLKENFPGLPLHASTQMCIAGKYGADILKEYGVSRIVPARELSLEEIVEIKKETGMEVECFIHGAMCYSYSGQCLFSSFLGGRSGNRGRCAGPCRLSYSLWGEKDIYPLSLKDMCTLPILHRLIDAGIDSFKIEGRMKNPYYVAGVTAVYRKYIDLYQESIEKGTAYKVDEKDMELLRSLYVRTELETGYYDRHNGKEMVTLQKPGYVTGDESEFTWLKEQYLDSDKKVELQCELTACIGEHLKIAVWHRNGKQVIKKGTQETSKALKRPVSREDIEKQLSKTGNTPFHFSSLSVIMDKDMFVPLKEINEIRRAALEEMEKLLTGDDARIFEDKPVLPTDNHNALYPVEKGIKIAVTAKEQLETTMVFFRRNEEKRSLLKGIELHFTLLEILENDSTFTKELARECEEGGFKLYLCMPQVGRKRGMEYCDRFLTDERLHMFHGFYCGNLDAVGYIRKRIENAGIPDGTKKLYGDYSLYAYNAGAVSFLQKIGISGIVGSYELNRHEWQELLKNCSFSHKEGFEKEYLVYGHVPFMQSAGCIKKTLDRCDGKNTVTWMRDRMGKKLPVMNFCQICENTVYNGVVMTLQQELEQIICDDYRISFTVEDHEQTQAVLDSFILDMPLPVREFTKGHFKKGIE